MARNTTKPSLAKQLLWFASLWVASVAVLAIFAYGIRLALRH